VVKFRSPLPFEEKASLASGLERKIQLKDNGAIAGQAVGEWVLAKDRIS
jgi:hypothetical protein